MTQRTTVVGVSSRFCSLCRTDFTRRANGLCAACNAYERKYGRPAPWDVILRRLNRRFDRTGEPAYLRLRTD